MTARSPRPASSGISGPKKLELVVRFVIGSSQPRRRAFEQWAADRVAGLSECSEHAGWWRLVGFIGAMMALASEELAAYLPSENREDGA